MEIMPGDIFSLLGLSSVPEAGWQQLLVISYRLMLALLVGGVLGFEREMQDKAAGLRTHMLVALGAALFTMVICLDPQSTPSDLSQVVKGVAAGVGFLGAGAILKGSRPDEIQGLTTAASIWMAAAAGLAVGAGWIWIGLLATAFAGLVLALSRLTERGNHLDK